jgi:hypothetical protein
MRRSRFSGVMAVLGGFLLVAALATQAMAQDGAETQATASKANRLQAKLMTDEQLDQVTAGLMNGGCSFNCGVFKVGEGIWDLGHKNNEGFFDLGFGLAFMTIAKRPSLVP